MFENINIHSSVAVYVQIENLVRFAVASGKLKSGDQLPSVRELSEKLEINPNTVAKSYRDLEVMGIVFTRRGMGVYISRDAASRCTEDCRRRVIGRLHEVVAEAKSAGMTGQEIKQVCAKCLDSDAVPYQDTPAAILSMAKTKGK
ncbi:MAG TPA: GntR family transcriptional regulator [Candidatus Hydrogenedentes bacterium]|nr:GntR family transcriptional regulator [Candidatus Hydrogenedentota bacterium]